VSPIEASDSIARGPADDLGDPPVAFRARSTSAKMLAEIDQQDFPRRSGCGDKSATLGLPIRTSRFPGDRISTISRRILKQLLTAFRAGNSSPARSAT